MHEALCAVDSTKTETKTNINSLLQTVNLLYSYHLNYNFHVWQIEVCIAAVDGGHPTPLSSTVTVTLNIVDVNDSPPRFTQSSYTFGTYENQPRDTEIGRLVAVDADSPPHDRFIYSVVAEKPPIGAFVIGRRSGQLATARELDRELTRVHHILVAATDVASPQLSSTVNVTVFVADRNDNAPVVSFPRPGNDSVEVSNYVMTLI